VPERRLNCKIADERGESTMHRHDEADHLELRDPFIDFTYCFDSAVCRDEVERGGKRRFNRDADR
jgi:hypothetical protein